ncbi:hypothetical protein SAMD00019534_110230 [Acytostelium subglobosum LB1]|uniref:hypothetical protein n=1 Tax=Acytostelium subglobosum LB1 TaxID=1410327 RepID=UPI00064494BA|nr:hypothetical protein SAMD00019534_110230 [Acytostelium subglobosum LB1]GAM27847.1 hypothetical protein SAMD00019534_110230 [Acytostelium subglobosum LB1]|eukprot:XP_012749130.1 hypothetical protein SAMD00019534_110230 [Acytostelium subglobosum LB1]
MTDFMDFNEFNIGAIDDELMADAMRRETQQYANKKVKSVQRERRDKLQSKPQQHPNQRNNKGDHAAGVDGDEGVPVIDKISEMDKESVMYIGKENSIRGVDISDVDHVFILNITLTPASYLHMAGRCGRLGKKGHVVSIYNVLLSRKYTFIIFCILVASWNESERESAKRTLDVWNGAEVSGCVEATGSGCEGEVICCEAEAMVCVLLAMLCCQVVAIDPWVATGLLVESGCVEVICCEEEANDPLAGICCEAVATVLLVESDCVEVICCVAGICCEVEATGLLVESDCVVVICCAAVSDCVAAIGFVVVSDCVVVIDCDYRVYIFLEVILSMTACLYHFVVEVILILILILMVILTSL